MSQAKSTRPKLSNNLAIFWTIGFLGLICAVLEFGFANFWGLPYPFNTPLLSGEDRYMDFFHVNHIVSEMSPYLTHNSNYTPFALLIARIFGLGYDSTMNPFLARYYGDGDPSLACLFVLFGVGLILYIWQRMRDFSIKEKIVSVLLIYVSYPTMFMLDRGNYLAIAVVLIALFALAYSRNQWVAALFLAAAISMKIYLGLFGVLFLFDRKYIAFLVTGLFVIALNLFPLMLFDGTPLENLNIMFKNILDYSNGGGYLGISVSFQNSIVAPLRIIRAFLITFPAFLQTGLYWLSLALACIFAGLAMAKSKTFEFNFVLLSVFLVLFQPMSPDYNLVILVPSLVIFLSSRNEQYWLELLLFSLLFIFKGYSVLYFSGQHYYATIQCLLNPLILLSLFLLLIKRQNLYVELGTRT